jgi:hypothetical protein
MGIKRFEARRPIRSIGNCRRPASRLSDDPELAVLKIARVRYQIFRDRFGRAPRPDEPLFFDSKHREPVIAGETEMFSQIMDAAIATRSDCKSVMKYLGLD